MVKQLQPVWDLTSSAFKSASELQELISIASQPNVQPQAILASEQLGAGLLASPERIDEAILALKGAGSVRLESLQIKVGLNTEELHRVMRNSTGLIQFFICISACKLCYVDSELGDVTFEMMIHSSLLAKYPVASLQIAQFVKAFSGQAESIVPVTLMQEIAVAMSEHGAIEAMYSRLKRPRQLRNY